MAEQAMVDFVLDDEQHWVAVLACGHRQHVRHRPPLVAREWVLSPAGRQSRLGQTLWCKHCEAEALKAPEVQPESTTSPES